MSLQLKLNFMFTEKDANRDRKLRENYYKLERFIFLIKDLKYKFYQSKWQVWKYVFHVAPQNNINNNYYYNYLNKNWEII